MEFIFEAWLIIKPILVFIILFSFLILIHECGHFFAARWAGVKVEEFGLGLGKTVYKKKVGETVYSLNAIPFGGFVQMLGEEDYSSDPKSYEQATLFKRIIITIAGVFMNFVFAFFMLAILFGIGIEPIFISQEDVIKAKEQGIIILSEANEEGKQKILEIKKIKKSPVEALVFAAQEMHRISVAIVKKAASIPGYIIRNHKLPDDLGGPVAIAETTFKIVPKGILDICKLAALLSLSLAVMNLLPIPALDGGRLLFQIIESILCLFGQKINQKIERAVHFG